MTSNKSLGTNLTNSEIKSFPKGALRLHKKLLYSLFPVHKTEIRIFSLLPSTLSKFPFSGLQGTWRRVQNHTCCPQTWAMSPSASDWRSASCTRPKWIISRHELPAQLKQEHSWLTYRTEELWQSLPWKSTERKFTLGVERTRVKAGRNAD